ncbi:MAG: tRNA (adenosine(37)-N6)-threonylcarbamoyltransferase complex dimerization subunit type 1 TsaB [Planctomycetota bacterium]|jgi:tRNA threonylcarbamoyladenosine biosynthesis protein TsaB
MMLKKSLILALETSGRIGSVAIAHGQQILAKRTFSGPMRHIEEIFPGICEILEKIGRTGQEIKEVYISIGPGSFTGLRIAATIAKMMHLACEAKIVAVDTLDVIAANVIDDQLWSKQKFQKTHPTVKKIAVILDAKRGQFFVAVYQYRQNTHSSQNEGKWEKILPDSLMTAKQFVDEFASSNQTIWLLGEGLLHHREKFQAEGIGFLGEEYWWPTAEKIHRLGYEKSLRAEFAEPIGLQPVYLRRPQAQEKWAQGKPA